MKCTACFTLKHSSHKTLDFYLTNPCLSPALMRQMKNNKYLMKKKNW